MSNIGAIGTSANLSVEVELDDIKSRADIARHEKDIDIVLKASEIKIIAADWRGRGFLAAERRYRGARDGRRVGFQAAADRADRQLRWGRPPRSLFYVFE